MQVFPSHRGLLGVQENQPSPHRRRVSLGAELQNKYLHKQTRRHQTAQKGTQPSGLGHQEGDQRGKTALALRHEREAQEK